MAPLFLSVVEFIKNRNFEVIVPAFYHPHMPAEMVNPKPAPLEKVNRHRMVAVNRRHSAPFNPVEDPDRLQRASYSIEIMLDMFRKKIEFQIVNQDDIPEIFDGLDRYLLSIKTDVEMGNERSVEYARLVIAWREEVYKHYYRYMKEHPAAMEKLYPNNDPTKNLLHLMSLMGGVRKDIANLDPLRARAEPPYRVDAVLPVSKSGNTAEDFMESSLGLSGGGMPLNDDGKGFDFEDFLKG